MPGNTELSAVVGLGLLKASLSMIVSGTQSKLSLEDSEDEVAVILGRGEQAGAESTVNAAGMQ